MTDRLLPASWPAAALRLRRWFIGPDPKPTGNRPDSTGNTAELTLIEAAEAGKLEMVEKLLGSGVNVNEQADDQSTALHHAAQEGHVEVARRLIEAGADINAKDDIDQTPGDRADFGNRTRFSSCLIATQSSRPLVRGIYKPCWPSLNPAWTSTTPTPVAIRP